MYKRQVPVIAVIAILYNSPFALFLPPLESGDTVQTVTSAYVQEFNRDVNTKVNEHTGYDPVSYTHLDVYKRQLLGLVAVIVAAAAGIAAYKAMH